ncbi:MAG: glucuronate isomerase [Anaeroplasmataceae bacterium]|nr:glucuronate isomerase [Anaeroplasmataceae bacterium]
MKEFMDKDFLLTTETAKKLYHEHAEHMPIIDYHCHLQPKEIYEDKKFRNLAEVWLGAGVVMVITTSGEAYVQEAMRKTLFLVQMMTIRNICNLLSLCLIS